MKESIINNDYMRGLTNPSSNHGDSKQFDPRLENIDKINTKIKQTLSCLAEGEKKPSNFTIESQHYLPFK